MWNNLFFGVPISYSFFPCSPCFPCSLISPLPILCHFATVVAVWKEVEKLAVAVGNFKGCFPSLR
ncbi:hypothetical protein GXM_03992 [Nostoc sphaeroides CCNUC1]|uniref:Uncharacterized protein n=2 Tax=Nostoc sphaeroides TaxID=446679 RepID=A0A5P8W1P0_9NOSO|nr:hypothetical protein GXM_03992 [Nostoc sphaeroides CCNUC1]